MFSKHSSLFYRWVFRSWLVAVYAILFLAQGLNAATVIEHDSYWQLPIPEQGAVDHNLPDVLTNLSASNCGLCHVKQYQDWQNSFHAKAVGEGLLGQLSAFDQETQKDCLRCHAPRQEPMNKLLKPSDGHVSSDGVDCASCHVRKHIRHGSRDIALTPHGSVKGLPLFKQAEFCKSCHQLLS